MTADTTTPASAADSRAERMAWDQEVQDLQYRLMETAGELVAAQEKNDDLRYDIEKYVARINAVVRALAPVDGDDWRKLFLMLPDSGHGRFWKGVLAELRRALDAQKESRRHEQASSV